jgi:hypothetical protein
MSEQKREIRLVGEPFCAANWDENEWTVGGKAVNDAIAELTEHEGQHIEVIVRLVDDLKSDYDRLMALSDESIAEIYKRLDSAPFVMRPKPEGIE